MGAKKLFPYFAFLLFLLISLFAFVSFGLQKRTSLPSQAGEDKVQLWLLPTQAKLKKGEEVEVRVFLVSKEKEVGGVDLVLRYDPGSLEIVGNTIKPGTIFNYYRDRLVDSRRGIIRLSSSGSFKGEGTFASFVIKGREVGQGKIEIVTPKVSADSTAVWDTSQKVNILGNVYNLSFEVY